MKSVFSYVILILAITTAGWWAYHLTYPADDFNPSPLTDVLDKTVLVPSEDGDKLLGWKFHPSDVNQITKVDSVASADLRSHVVYVTVNVTGQDNEYLKGVMELHYRRVGDQHHLVALQPISMKISTVEPKAAKKGPIPLGPPPDRNSFTQPLPKAKNKTP